MKTNTFSAVVLIVICLLLCQHTYAQKRKTTNKEVIELHIIHDKKLGEQITNAQQDMINPAGDDRFLLGMAMTLGNIAYSMIVGSVVDSGISSLKQKMQTGSKRYNSQWTASVSKDFFYSNTSFNSAIDPSNMQFGGFKAIRYSIPDAQSGQVDTAFYFAAKINNVEDIVKTSRFMLSLDTLMIDLSKTKALLPKGKSFDLDVQIKITSSWVNDATEYFQNQEMGVFNIGLRGIVYDPENPKYILTGAKGKINGSCFVIPRSSYGMVNSEGRYVPCYGMGEYGMTITVKEKTNVKTVVNDFFNDYVIKVVDTYGNSVKSSKIIETGIEIAIPGESSKSTSAAPKR